MSRLRSWIVLVAAVLATAAPAAAQSGSASLRVTVADETAAVLLGATVLLAGNDGAERTLQADDFGLVNVTGLTPGDYTIGASYPGFQPATGVITLKRGTNQTTMTLPLAAIAEEVSVAQTDASERRDNGFTQTLSQEEIDGLSDDPDEMAEQLAQMAGPGAQIFVDGFRGGRLPPKDQIQQIRFRTNSYAAEYHDAGMVRVEVITRPGMGGWRSRVTFGFRDTSLNARNAFAATRPPEQVKRVQVSSQGPIVKGKTSVTFSVDANQAYDAQTIVAATPGGDVRDQVRRPNDVLNTNIRLEHALSPGNSIRAEYQRRSQDRNNLGVGDFNLQERAWASDAVTDTLRLRNTRTIGKKVFSELKFEFVQSTSENTSLSSNPTLQVLDAFTGGGAGQTGVREGRQFTVDQSVDFTIRKHALRAGVLFEAGQWDSTQQTNANGTYTFSSLADFEAGVARTFTRRVGDPRVSYSQYQVGWYVQDDFRLSKNLQASLGLRQELQTNLGDKWNLAPRAAFTWTVKKTNVRGGYGIFYDWFEAQTYEQTVRVDGVRQIDEVILNPTFPVTATSGGTRLPASRIQAAASLTQPIVQQASIGFDKNLREWMGVRADYMWTRGYNQFRSVNVNAPVNGVRPDLTVGNISEIASSGRRASDRLSVGVNLRVPQKRIFGNVMYQLGSVRNHADSALSLPADSTRPDADWGPAAQDVRHRLFLLGNAPLPFGLRVGLNARISSARPYNITTGFDTNGDTVFNDRPDGVGRNSARGAAQMTVDMRLTKSFNLGGLLSGGPEGVPMGGAPLPSARSGAAPAMQRGPGGGGGDGPRMVIMEGSNARYRADFYVNVQNLFNRTNLNGFSGNQLSPFFGQATSAAAARRIEVGATKSF
ncbi:MAG: carboxypeptidase-like regulatory domain-containing protein [Vicinamibacterales bacterium]